MTGAEDECPYHPRHAPILPPIGDLAGLHHGFFPRMTRSRYHRATTARHAASSDHVSTPRKSRRSKVSAALYSNADASTALVTRPIQGSEPVRKYALAAHHFEDVRAAAPRTDASAATQAMTTAISSGRQMSPNSVDRNDARLKNSVADEEQAQAVRERVDHAELLADRPARAAGSPAAARSRSRNTAPGRCRPGAEQLFARHRQRQREVAPSPSTIPRAGRRSRAGREEARPSASGCRERR